MIVPRPFVRACLGLAAVVLWSARVVAGTAPAAPDGPLTFEQHVRPILKAHCFHCHGEQEKPKGKLDLRLVRLMIKGGRSGEAIVPGDHEQSYLWMRLDADEMPPGDKKLSTAEKSLIAAWIDQGARTIRPEPEALAPGPVFSEEERSFWSFQPVRRPEVPRVRHADLVRTPIDAFLLERLEAKGLRFAPEADRRTLIRRATFDLLGLPPTPEEVTAFLNDEAPDAYERLLDRLLASPHYGERWARHWLDVAGYADSDGYSAKDPERKYAYKYRDYLIRALNADRPWDALIREQLAGDEMLRPPYQNLSPEEQDRLIATGFLRMAPDGTGDPEADQDAARNDVIAETIKIVSTSLLGLTVGCAQCHAHRYDPISQEDYYRFRALFEPALDPKNWRTPTARLVSLWNDADRAKAAEVDAEIKQIEKERTAALEALVAKVLEAELAEAPEALREKLREARDTPKNRRTEEQKQLLKDYPRVLVSIGNVSLYDAKAHGAIMKTFAQRIEAVRAQRPAEDFIHALTEVPGQVPTTHLFARGDYQQPRQAVEPGELTILAAKAPTIPVDDPDLPTTGRRLAYARHLTSGRHPLVARVLVNRLWLHHFGRGIVGTPADFGTLGERPSHPELLDWLADEFVRGGWTLKRLHRLLMTSTAYRQSSRRDPATEAVDPDNRLLGRMPVRRLEAEAVRDAILTVSGRLNPALYGPPVPVAPDESGQVIVGKDNRDSAGRPTGKRVPLGGAEFRRSVYIQVRRSLPLGLLEVFDAPTPAPNCEQRTASTVAPQALMMLNNEFVVRESEAFAARVERSAGDEVAAQVRLAWRLALAADPSPEQVTAALEFIEQQRADFAAAAHEGKMDAEVPSPSRRALASFCQALLGSNAFLYVD
ncbi:MAG: PSD1 domain-containing protein [Isosphaeraceae bacterium]|nr:PSD1 domain-containing protein [Isosphaeraceae bacterium]